MKRRVVVTGLGAITPVGNDVATTWRSLLEGKSGAAPITKFDASTFPVRFACEVKAFDPNQYMDRKEARRYDPFTQYAVATAVQAMTDAGLGEATGYDPELAPLRERKRLGLEARVPQRLIGGGDRHRHGSGYVA